MKNWKYIILFTLLIIVVVSVVIFYYRLVDPNEEEYEPIYEHIVIGGTVYECEPYIDAVFKNFQRIGQLFKKCSIIIAIDIGTDKSLDKLQQWQTYFMNSSSNKFKLYISEGVKSGIHRTENISNARNRILKQMRIIKQTDPFEHFIMMDCDDECTPRIQLDILKNILEKKSQWDAVTFIGNNTHQPENYHIYYDMWALSIRPYLLSFVHYDDVVASIKSMYTFIHKEIKKGKWIPCYSAFNGFGLYHSSFLKYTYHWKFKDTMKLIPKDLQIESIKTMGLPFLPEKLVNDCEHRYFHLSATLEDNARMFIIPEFLFTQPEKNRLEMFLNILK